MTTKIPAELSSTPGIADSSNATAITIDSNEKVGINNTTPGNSYSLANTLVVGDGSTHEGITIFTGTSNTGAFHFADGAGGGNAADTYAGYIAYDHANDRMRLGAGSSDRVRISTDGLLFGTDTATANALDDYEEGTFTPVYTSTGLSVTHDIQNGLYTKIGDTVHFWILLGTDAVSGTGSSILQITGLPYTCKNTASSFVSGAVGLAYTFASNEQNMKWFIGSNTSLIALYDGDSNVGGVFPSSKLGTTSNDNRLYISGSYKTD